MQEARIKFVSSVCRMIKGKDLLGDLDNIVACPVTVAYSTVGTHPVWERQCVVQRWSELPRRPAVRGKAGVGQLVLREAVFRVTCHSPSGLVVAGCGIR